MVLVNGICGLGTGWVSDIPQFNPLDIIEIVESKLKGFTPNELLPWTRNHLGKYTRTDGVLTSHGVYNVSGDTLSITELPVGVWTEKVEAQLKNPKSKLEFTKVEENHTDVTVQFTVKGIKDMDKMIKALKLEKNVRENYVVFSEGHLRTTTVANIIDTHYEKRLRLYHSRVDAQKKALLSEIQSMEGKLNFIEACINGKIPLTTATHDELVAVCTTLGVDSIHLDMKLRDLTKQNVVKLKQSIEEARGRHKVLCNTPVTDIWLKELQELKGSIGSENKKRTVVDLTV